MKRIRIWQTIVQSIGLVLLLALPLRAQEHPEHPTEQPKDIQPQEQTQSPEEVAKKAPITMAKLSLAIQAYVADDCKLKGGKFLVRDAEANKVLELTLAKVHEDKLASLGGGIYFACADFQASDGHLYDLDMFMREGERGLEMTDVSVHKVDGEARYGWEEEKGTWKKKQIKK